MITTIRSALVLTALARCGRCSNDTSQPSLSGTSSPRPMQMLLERGAAVASGCPRTPQYLVDQDQEASDLSTSSQPDFGPSGSTNLQRTLGVGSKFRSMIKSKRPGNCGFGHGTDSDGTDDENSNGSSPRSPRQTICEDFIPGCPQPSGKQSPPASPRRNKSRIPSPFGVSETDPDTDSDSSSQEPDETSDSLTSSTTERCNGGSSQTSVSSSGSGSDHDSNSESGSQPTSPKSTSVPVLESGSARSKSYKPPSPKRESTAHRLNRLQKQFNKVHPGGLKPRGGAFQPMDPIQGSDVSSTGSEYYAKLRSDDCFNSGS